MVNRLTLEKWKIGVCISVSRRNCQKGKIGSKAKGMLRAPKMVRRFMRNLTSNLFDTTKVRMVATAIIGIKPIKVKW